MVLLENEQFLSELTKFYEKAKTNGTVLTSMKRYDGRVKPNPRPGSKRAKAHTEPSEYMCLIRASMGSKKIRTVVHAKDMNKFQQAYSLLIRAYIELKKKEKAVASRGADKSKSKSGGKKPAAAAPKQPQQPSSTPSTSKQSSK